MAQSVTVSSLITLVRQMADIERSQVCTDTEIVSYINKAYRELYNAIVLAHQNYFVSSGTITLVPGTDTYAVPSDFMKLLGVDLVVDSSQSITLLPYNLNERNRSQTGLIYTHPLQRSFRYILMGSNLKFVPKASIPSGTVTVWYVPAPADLTSVSSFDAINGLDEYVTAAAAEKCLIKQNLPSKEVALLKQEKKQMVIETCAGRDAGMTLCVTDLDNVNEFGF